MKQREEYTIPIYSEDGFEGTIEPLNLEISDNLKHFLDWQEYLKSKWDYSVLRTLTEDENIALEEAFKDSLQKQPTLKRK